MIYEQGIKHYAIFVVHYNYNYIPKICSALHYNYIFCTTTTITIIHYIYEEGRGVPKTCESFGCFWAFQEILKILYFGLKIKKIFKNFFLQFLGPKTSKNSRKFFLKK